MPNAANEPLAVSRSRFLAVGRLGVRLQEAGDEVAILQTLHSGLVEAQFVGLIGRLDSDAQIVRMFPTSLASARPGLHQTAVDEDLMDQVALDSAPLIAQVVGRRETVFLADCLPALSSLLPNASQTLAGPMADWHEPPNALCAPMIAHGRVSGLLLVVGSGLDEGHASDIGVLADHLAVTLENSAVLGDLKQALLREHDVARELRRLEGLAAELSAESEPRSILQRVADEARDALGAERIGVFVLAKDEPSLLLVASVGIEDKLSQALSQSASGEGEGPLARVIAEGAPLVIEDTRNDPSWASLLAVSEATGVRSVWMAPLSSQTGVGLGLMAFFSGRTGKPGQQQLDLAQRYARHAALAIENNRRQESEKDAARNEAVVGLARSIPHELGQPLAIIAGYAELIAEGLLDGERLREACADLVEASARLAEHIQRLEQMTTYTTKEASPGRTVIDFERSSQ